MKIGFFVRRLFSQRPSAAPSMRRQLRIEGLEDRTVLSHGLGVGPALVGAFPSSSHDQVGLVGSQHDRGEVKGDDAAHHQAALTLSQTVTADLTASTTFRLTGFSVVNGNLVATGTVAGQPVTANVGFTAATGTTPPTITLSFPQQTVQVGGATVTLSPITLNLTGPGAPTTPLGTAIGSIAGTLNGQTAPADIAAALNGVVTSANSVLSGITATGPPFLRPDERSLLTESSLYLGGLTSTSGS